MANTIINLGKKVWASFNALGKMLVSGAIGLAALFGAYKLITSRPKIEFNISQTPIWGYYNDIENGKRYAQYLVEASIVNHGDKPYFPASYKMTVSYPNGKVIYEPFSITDTFLIPQMSGDIVLFDRTKDLVRVTKIESDGVVNGMIWFRTEVTPEIAFIDISHYDFFKFSIFDTNGKQVESKTFTYLPVRGKGFSPKSGVEIK